MKYLDLTFADPASNLACDEALIDFSESEHSDGVLRLWEPLSYFVVAGYSNRLATEVHTERCRAEGIPILRRFSGGGTVLQGPGCLNYSVVLPNKLLGDAVDLLASYRFVLRRHREIFVQLLGEPIEIAGTSDLALGGRKFSGNAQHRKRYFTLFHGSFLLDFDLSRIETLLPLPSKEPRYRGGRKHQDFLSNAPVDRERLRAALKCAWGALEPLRYDTEPAIQKLLYARYNRTDWNFKF